jgi:hypothetical protein
MTTHKGGNKVLIFLVMVCLYAATIPDSAFSRDTGELYSAGAPEGSAFFRVLIPGTGLTEKGTETGTVSSVWIGATEFTGLETQTVTPYRPVTTGIHQVVLHGEYTEVVAREGQFYTVALTSDGVLVFEDRKHSRPDRAQIFLYNLSDLDSVRLGTADGATTVIGPTRTGESGVIEVNPIEVELAVLHQDTDVASLGDVGLKRGQSYSVFVMSLDQSTRVRVIQAEILPE